MAAGPEDLTDAEPFSPSAFLDLPPTPRPDGDGPASSEDLVLPFISRMLMEDDVDYDDGYSLYRHPDHPALLQAQQPFAEILSESEAAAAAAAGSTEAASFALLPPSFGASALASATWPYDPFQLSQQLLLSAGTSPDLGAGLAGASASRGVHKSTDEASSFLNGGGDGESTQIQSSMFPAGAKDAANTTAVSTTAANQEHDMDSCLASAAIFCGQSRVTMDMLNRAFLKGMEEASRFLPTHNHNSLLVDLKSFNSGDHDHRNGNKKQLVFHENGSYGRGRKNRHADSDELLEAEAGRNRKLMAPEPQEAGDMVDKMVVDGYDMCMEKMKGLHITRSSEGTRSRRSAQGRKQSSTAAVDLHTLLVHCAHAVSMGDHRAATELLGCIKQRSSPLGDATQRLAHYFAEGLAARHAGTGSQVHKQLASERASAVEFLRAYQLYLTSCCFEMIAYIFSGMTISKAVAGRKKVHIVDYGARHYGFQWPSLLAYMATWEGGPPEVRMTGIDTPQPGFRPAARVVETGRRLSSCARDVGVPFKFQHVVAARWEAARVEDLRTDPDEVLVVNSITDFGSLMGDDGDGGRDVLLGNIRKMRPDAFILCVVNGPCSTTPFFLTRFKEALSHYSAMFDMLAATVPSESSDDQIRRLAVERDLVGRLALNAIACEGSDRVERPETYKQWQARNHRAGLRQLPLHQDIVRKLKRKVSKYYHKDFVIDVDKQWLLQGWKGRILYAMSTWAADDAAL